MGTILKQMLTGKDNETHDVGRWGLALGLLSLVALTGGALVRGQMFDPVTYAGAFTSLLVGGAGALRLKAPTEPGA